MPAEVFAMPLGSFSAARFELRRFMAANELYGGRVETRQLTTPRWEAEYTTVHPLKDDERDIWRAWWATLRGGERYFYAWDPEKQYPRLYPSGFTGLVKAGTATPFTGIAEVTEFLSSEYHIDVEQTPASFTLRSGDMVEVREGIQRGLFRIVADTNMSTLGVGRLTVEPRIPTGLFTAAAQVNFYRPACVMRPRPESFDRKAVARENPPISFAGIQAVKI